MFFPKIYVDRPNHLHIMQLLMSSNLILQEQYYKR